MHKISRKLTQQQTQKYVLEIDVMLKMTNPPRTLEEGSPTTNVWNVEHVLILGAASLYSSCLYTIECLYQNFATVTEHSYCSIYNI